MDWQGASATVLIGLVVYILGAFFTAGIRLWPRWRDAEGNIRNNPLHIIEAIFWPIAWYVWVYGYLGWFTVRGLLWILRVVARIPPALLRVPRWIYRLGEQINDY